MTRGEGIPGEGDHEAYVIAKDSAYGKKGQKRYPIGGRTGEVDKDTGEPEILTPLDAALEENSSFHKEIRQRPN